MYDESPEILRYLEKWQAPTKQHIPDQADNYRQVPEAYAYGLPAMQTQHTCILLQDIIEHCNLRCPTCFTASGPQLQGVAPLSEVLANIDARLARENGRLDVLMLSGGEPTLYPYLAELLDAARRPADRPDHGQQQRHAHRHRRRTARTAGQSTATGWRCTSSTTARPR